MRLRDALAEVQVRRRKREVLPQLPAKLVTDLDLELTDAQRSAHDRAAAEGLVHLASLGSEVRVANVLELILRLKQICNFDPETGSSSKADDLEERVAQVVEAGERALVFSQFRSAQFGANAIAARLARFQPVVYTGEVQPALRDRLVSTFKHDSDRAVMVLSLRSGGRASTWRMPLMSFTSIAGGIRRWSIRPRIGSIAWGRPVLCMFMPTPVRTPSKSGSGRSCCVRNGCSGRWWKGWVSTSAAA